MIDVTLLHKFLGHVVALNFEDRESFSLKACKAFYPKIDCSPHKPNDRCSSGAHLWEERKEMVAIADTISQPCSLSRFTTWVLTLVTSCQKELPSMQPSYFHSSLAFQSCREPTHCTKPSTNEGSQPNGNVTKQWTLFIVLQHFQFEKIKNLKVENYGRSHFATLLTL